MVNPLARQFYHRDTIEVARDMLGKILIRKMNGERLSGMIVETEAYRAGDDPASHAFRGMTERNKVMFGEPGHAYVYFTYGNHFCLNITAKDRLPAGAVLIRAVEPLEGLETMLRNRNVGRITDTTSGPGKLTKAMSITREHDGTDVCKVGELYVGYDIEPRKFIIRSSSRIGIANGTDKQWRFFIRSNPYVSRKTSSKR